MRHDLKIDISVFCTVAVLTFSACCPACSLGLPNLAYRAFSGGKITDVMIANLVWPPVAGFPSYYAGNHSYPDWIQNIFVFWGLFIVPMGTGALLTRLVAKLKRGRYEHWKIKLYWAVLVGYVLSILAYFPIPRSLWGCGYFWMTY